jgi:hypothetical protein
MVFHPGFLAIGAEVEAIDVTFLFFIGEIEVGTAISEQLFAEGGLVIFVGVGPAMDPDESKRIGAMVSILDLYKAVERTFGIVEGDIDGVADLLLPVGLGAGVAEGASADDK